MGRGVCILYVGYKSHCSNLCTGGEEQCPGTLHRGYLGDWGVQSTRKEAERPRLLLASQHAYQGCFHIYYI